MEQWKSVDEVLDFAVGQEEEAARFYTDLADRMDRPWMSDVFMQFAKEEQWHKKKLEDVKAGKRLLAAEEKVLDLKIGDYLVAPETTGELDYQQALVLAMKKEKKAFLLYHNLAATTDDENLKNVFLGLAQEEAKHKLRFEVEYDDYVMTEN
ncbi:MAG: ferritin family protein [Desulfomonilaceae bacterium]|nr:ferritin family protein [Desulfomonilaceae bacterium]